MQRVSRDTPLRVALLLLWLVCWPTTTHADWAPPYPIIDTSESASLGFYLAWMEDPGSNLGIEQIAVQPATLFTVSDRDALRFGYTRSSYWFRLAIQNTRANDQQLLLDVPHPRLSLLEFYREHEGHYEIISSGTASQRVIGDISYPHYLFRADIPAGSTRIFWFHARSDAPLSFSIQAEQLTDFTQQLSSTSLIIGCLFGLLFALSCFNLISWLLSRDPIFAWYLFFLVTISAYLSARLGYIGILFLRGPDIQPLVETLAGLLAMLCALQFTRILLLTRARQAELDQWLFRILVAGGIVFLVAPLMENTQRIPLYTWFAGLATAPLLYAAWRAYRQEIPDAGRYLVIRIFSTLVCAVALADDLGWQLQPLRSATLLLITVSIEGTLISILLISRSTRQRRQLAKSRLETAIVQAENRARTEFLSRFSHEIRTPLNGILGMTELLGDSSLTPRQREYTLTIRSSTENLATLLSETLDWTRIESGQLEIQHLDFDLSQLIAESMDTVQLRAEEKHIELVVDFSPALPARVNGDPARIRQVLCNLLGNAVRYTHSGEVHLFVSTTEQPHLVRMEVRDTGVGIARDRLATLFEKYDGQQPSSEHRGFGLYIARQLVERMGGRIGATSEEHRGSTFWFTLPLPAALEQLPANNADILIGKRLLVVDDSAAVRRVIEAQASNWRMSVVTADNAQEALAIARTHANLGNSFDVVVLDHNMPGMSGLQLAARIKEDPLIRHDALIVMLTGLNIAPTDTMARNVGIRRVLTKPVSGRALQAVLIEELVRRESFEPDPANSTPLSPNLRVLVVEDNALSQKVIRGMLAKLGVRNDVVSNGQEALDAIQHHRYDLLLMDCEMPVMDGYEATQRIRAWEADNAKRRTPIIALSAHIMKEIKERCRLSGMDAHMAKPVDLNELRETLRIYCAS